MAQMPGSKRRGRESSKSVSGWCREGRRLVSGCGWRKGKGTPEKMGRSCLFCVAQEGGRSAVSLTTVSSELSSELEMMMLVSSAGGTGGR